MMYFTSDWHIGEQAAPHTFSYLRPRPTEVMVGEWLANCHNQLQPDDTFVFVGDVGITLDDLDVLLALPPCKKILVCGNKEYDNANFAFSEFIARNMVSGVFDELHQKTCTMEVAGRTYVIGHEPLDCIAHAKDTDMPALCGHVHRTWGSQYMPNKQPIINVGIDTWGMLVDETIIAHQYAAVTEHYDDHCFQERWFQ